MAALKKYLKSKKTHCTHGHKFTKTTTYINRQGYRSCRECKRIAMARWRKDI